jgi:hypothetical protein
LFDSARDGFGAAAAFNNGGCVLVDSNAFGPAKLPQLDVL